MNSSNKKVKLNIAVVGWFGYLNGGDDRIGEVLIKLFYPHNVSLLSGKTVTPYIINQFDLCVFVAGTWHPRSHIANNFKNWSRVIKTPFAAIGLGVEETTDKSTIESYKYFVDKCEFVYVRDIQSAEALGGSFKIIVGEDVTWLNPFEVQKEFCLKDKILVNLRPYKEMNDKNEYVTRLLVDKYKNQLVFSSFSPQDTILGEKLGYDKIIEFDKVRLNTQTSLVVGMRFHSAIFASQKCVPHYNLPYHSKVNRLSTNGQSLINKHHLGFCQDFENFILNLNDELILNERELLVKERERKVQKMTEIKGELINFINVLKPKTEYENLVVKISKKLHHGIDRLNNLIIK